MPTRFPSRDYIAGHLESPNRSIAASLPVASAHSNSVGTLAATTTNTSSATFIYETGIFYWGATHRADTNGM